MSESRQLLSEIASVLNAEFIHAGFDASRLEIQQVLCLAEEAGEFVGAYRRWKGMARRDGTFDDVAAELADVVISAYICGDALDIDLDHAIEEKLKIIFSRGWKTVTEEKK